MEAWHKKSELPLGRFFSTNGQSYKNLDLKNRLPLLSEEEQYALLGGDGMLVKRPLLVGEDVVLVGFNANEWARRLKPSAVDPV